MPAVTLVLGAGLFAALWIGGRLIDGVVVLAACIGLSLVMALGAGGETVRGLTGAERDERFWQMDIFATALAGTAVILAVIVGFAVEVARGHSGAPYGWLAAVAGLTYIAGIVVYRRRR